MSSIGIWPLDGGVRNGGEVLPVESISSSKSSNCHGDVEAERLGDDRQTQKKLEAGLVASDELDLKTHVNVDMEEASMGPSSPTSMEDDLDDLIAQPLMQLKMYDALRKE
ncbi:hypothetical protein KFK09_019514 [Dendrobium nobile]|uniref:Uncharacterized protein n=1 Tax=Dendrobium nobile TaxID=94219 RepID=A0A8T3ARG9_DENNO|nr:hypothetical protein KFK09_019514 [Dendrobium nobile]